METPRRRYFEISSICFFVLMLSFLGTLFVYQNIYTGKIYKNVKIASIDVSGKTKKQAQTILNKKFDSVLNKNITFTAGEKSVTATLSETGLGFDINKSISAAYAVGRSHKFFPQLYASAKTTLSENFVSVPIVIDNTKLNLFISSKLPELNVPPQDASIQITDGKIIISPDIVGQQIDTSSLTNDLSKLVSSSSTEYKIQLAAMAVSSEITSTSLETQKSSAEKLINSKITLQYEDKSYSPSQKDISRWLSFNLNGKETTLSIDDSAIKAYLTTLAKNFEVIKKDKKINAVDNSTIEEGQQGKYLEKDLAISDIKKALDGSSSSTITLTTRTEDFQEVKVYPSEGVTPGKFEGKYLDVDLAQQKLCRVESNTVIDCFTISSGKASTPTPTGTRYIESKELKRWSSPYGLWMPFWQSLGGGYGIHDLPEWPSGYKEGLNHLGIPVSHGCIRLGSVNAELVYNWTEIGTPVFIHR